MTGTDNKEDKQLKALAETILQEQYPRHFLGDGLFVSDRAMGFYDDEVFTKVLNDIAKAPVYQQMAWRLHTLVWAAKSVMELEGDFVECGVFRGFKSDFLCRYFDFRSLTRSFYLYDTYEGIADKYSDGSPINNQEHNKPQLYDFVKQRFAQYDNVNVVQGVVPDVMATVMPTSVAFLHLDMNSYQAEIGALEKLWPLMPVGGIVILDDYGFHDFKAQKENHDIWFAKREHWVLEMPTGQGVVVKKHD